MWSTTGLLRSLFILINISSVLVSCSEFPAQSQRRERRLVMEHSFPSISLPSISSHPVRRVHSVFTPLVTTLNPDPVNVRSRYEYGGRYHVVVTTPSTTTRRRVLPVPTSVNQLFTGVSMDRVNAALALRQNALRASGLSGEERAAAVSYLDKLLDDLSENRFHLASRPLQSPGSSAQPLDLAANEEEDR